MSDFLDDTPLNPYEGGEQVTLTQLKQIANATEQLLRDRQSAYQRVFADPARRADIGLVLADLAAFCRAHTTTFRPDAREHAMLEGRREVWLRLRDHLDLTFDDLLNKYTNGEP